MQNATRIACRNRILASLYAHRYFGCLVLSYTAGVWAASVFFNHMQPAELLLYANPTLGGFGVMGALLLVRRLVYLARVEKEKYPIRRLVIDFKQWISSASQVISLLIVLLLLPSFCSAFTCFKSMLPVIQPFSWDTRLTQIDRFLHFGRLPCEWTRSLLSNVWVTFGVNWMYNVWIFVMWAFLFWQAFQNRRCILRMQYLISFALMWIVIGSFLAVALSSGGPCFYGDLTDGTDVYAEHMAWLHAVDSELREFGSVYRVWALDIQGILWDFYTSTRVGVGSGISAMPSMHVAVAMLMALTAWQYGSWLRWSFLLYLLVIQVGSVHLGWHYAVDGYVSIVVTLLIWRMAGPLARRATTPKGETSRQPREAFVAPSYSSICGESTT